MAALGSLSMRSPEQVQEDLIYLQEHNVCETLELIVKGLLRDQPEDPILSICNMLRTTNRSRSSVRFNGAAAETHGVFSAPECNNGGPLPGSAAGTPVTPESSVRPFPSVGIRADPGLRAGASASSRADTPASSVPQTKWNDAHSGKLERDESSRSDGSAFSISSIDMSEFLSEFRAAHMCIFGEQGGVFISLQELADIVDRVAIPIPDVKLLVDLFNELKEPGALNEGIVSFDAFLSRMNFRIQGKYPLEVIRNAFFTLLPADVVAMARPASTVGGRGLAANASVGSNLDAYLMGSSTGGGLLDATRGDISDLQGVSQLLQTTPCIATSVESVSHTALWHGLGLRHDPQQLEVLLLPFKKNGEYTLFFTDFTRIVHALASVVPR